MAKGFPITHNPVSCLSTIDFDDIPFGKHFTDHMFIADFDGQQWVDERIVPLEPMAVHPANMTFHYGQAIFEGMKATAHHDGTPMLFRPELHVERFNSSAVRMCMPEIPEELFLESIKQLVDLERAFIPKKEGSALYIRPFMIAMDDHIGVAASKTYRYIVICLPVGPYYPTPIKLLAQTEYVRAVKGGVGEAKTAGNYAASLMPAQTARAKGYHQMLWLDAVEHKFIQEVGTMNIFFVFGKTIVTPETDGCILKGITRATIIDILLDKGYHVEERPVTIHEVVEAHQQGNLVEVFGSGTAAVVSHVEQISFQDHHIRLSADKWTISTLVKEEINGLRSGRIYDTHGWTVPIDSTVLV